jgi:hypothetical protein
VRPTVPRPCCETQSFLVALCILDRGAPSSFTTSRATSRL